MKRTLPRPTPVPAGGSLGDLRTAAVKCRNRPLRTHAKQTVFGEGPEDARIVLAGEQPGNREDLAGRPFVGPAGQLLDRRALAAYFRSALDS